MEELKFHSADQTRHYLDTTITASKVFRVKNGRKIVFIHVTQRSAVAADAAKAVQFSHVVDPTDPTKVTVYAWKDDGSGGRTAATAETSIAVAAWTD